jgi:hypothetical protein
MSRQIRISFDLEVGGWFFPPLQGSEDVHRHHYQNTSLGGTVLLTTNVEKHKMMVLMQMVALSF